MALPPSEIILYLNTPIPYVYVEMVMFNRVTIF